MAPLVAVTVTLLWAACTWTVGSSSHRDEWAGPAGYLGGGLGGRGSASKSVQGLALGLRLLSLQLQLHLGTTTCQS